MTDEQIEEEAESYGVDLCCICRECDVGDTNPCHHDDCWEEDPAGCEIDPPVAWCEIPRYREDKTKEQPPEKPTAEHES